MAILRSGHVLLYFCVLVLLNFVSELQAVIGEYYPHCLNYCHKRYTLTYFYDSIQNYGPCYSTGDDGAPVFHDLPHTVNIGERETNRRLVYTLSVTDADSTYTCTQNAVDPFAEFEVNTIPSNDGNTYGIYIVQATVFDYAVSNTYNVLIDCSDTIATTKGVLTVDLIDEDQLVFTNLVSGTTAGPFDAMATGASNSVFTVGATDLLGHMITFSMATSDSFEINAGTGEITTRRDLKYEVQNTIDLAITVSDKEKIQVTEVLRVLLTNVNNAPTFDNLAITVDVLESVSSGTILHTTTGQDIDSGASLSYSIGDIDPLTSSSVFTFDPNLRQLKLATGQNFDFETRNFYNITFSISDTMATTKSYLAINIVDVPEKCQFTSTMHFASTYESTAGSVTWDPEFSVSDEDAGATWSYSLMDGNNSERFKIDPFTGVMTFAVDYDIDNSVMPSNTIITVQCVDNTDLTGTSQITITIQDVNDNAPAFTLPSYIMYSDQYTSPGTRLGSLTATDSDSGTNADYYCTATTSSPSATTYYNIGSDCGVYFTSNPSGLEYGTMRFEVSAIDKGIPALTGTTQVDVIFREVATTTKTTTTTTTTTEYDFFGRSENVAVFTLLLIAALLLLALLLYFCLRWCYVGVCCGHDPCDFMGCCNNNGCCQPRYDYPQRIRPEGDVRPHADRQQGFDSYSRTGAEFDYWRENPVHKRPNYQVAENRRTYWGNNPPASEPAQFASPYVPMEVKY